MGASGNGQRITVDIWFLISVFVENCIFKRRDSLPGENPAEDFLDEEFPLRFRPLLPSAMRRAYAAAGRVIEKVSFLNTPAGKLHRGDLIALAAEYEIERLAKAGVLPFDPTWEPYARPTGVHLVLRTARAKLTISQVEDGTRKPRDAVFRENYGMANKPYLFDFMNEEMRASEEARHLLLLHGYQALDFVYLAVPHAQNKRHIAQSLNLMLSPHVVASEAPEEGPRDSPDLETIDQLLRTVRDSGKSDD